MNKNIFDSIFGVLGGAVVYVFGGWDTVLITLCVFMAVDYLTGLVKAGVNKTLDSSVGFIGLLKKAAILLVIIVAVLLDRLSNQNVFRSIACMFYIANEGISILENIGQMGVPLPAALTKFLQKLKAENDKEE